MGRQIYLCALIILSGILSPLVSQPTSSIFSHYSTQDGLSHSAVMCIHEGTDGFMWFGTWDGLNKFDGYNFTVYKSKPGDTSSLSHNRVEQIVEDKFGYLWIKTYDEKVHRFDRKTETFMNFSKNISGKNSLDYHIKDIYESPKGDIWLITKGDGCIRIKSDPMTFKSSVYYYNTQNSDTLLIPGNLVDFVYHDRNNNIWISTEKGIAVYEGKRKVQLPYFINKPDQYHYTACMDDENILWLGSSNGQIIEYHYNSGSFIQHQLPVNSEITQILKTDDKKLLIGTIDAGIIMYDLESSQTLHFDKQRYKTLIDNHIRSLYLDKYGIVWIETDSAGVVRFKPDQKSFKRFKQVTDNVSPYVYYGDYFNIFEDINDVLWINLKKGGFCFYNRELDKIEYFYNEPESPERRFSNLVTSAISDSYGNLWLSTHSRGIEKISFINNKFEFTLPAQKAKALSANDVRSIYEDKNGYLWVGTKEGKLYAYKENKIVKIYTEKTNNYGDIHIMGMVYCIIQSSDGKLWFGTKGDGIVVAEYMGNPENMKFKTTHIRHDPEILNSLSHNWVYSIFEDHKQRIWVGTYGGGINLITNDSDDFSIFNRNNSQFTYPYSECGQIRHILEDAQNHIWIGTTNGLVILDPEQKIAGDQNFVLIQKDPGNEKGLANNDVHFILRDKNNAMWVSTFGGGLGKVVSSRLEVSSIELKNYNSNQGLPLDIVLSMQEDRQGNLWLSSENGLTRFDPEKELITSFSMIDGLKTLIFSEGASCKGVNGRLYFGSLEGFYSFIPENVKKEDFNPEMKIVGLQLFNKDVKVNDEHKILNQSISLTKAITLNYNQSVFSIEYAGLFYQNPDQLEYAFKLEGYDKDWNYVRNQRKATYTNLPAGDYSFIVKCGLSGNFNDHTTKELKIMILPPPWKSNWAIVGYIIGIILIIYLTRKIIIQILSLKHKVLLEQQVSDMKVRFFTNISHELRTPLSLIIGPIEELLQNSNIRENTRDYLEVIDKNARRMLSHVNNLLDFRKIQTGKMKLNLSEIEIVSFVRDIYEGFGQLAKLHNIDFRFKSDFELLKVWIDPDRMDTVIFNLLSNAFKFTPYDRKIELQINSYNNEKFELVIKDEGVGISETELPHIFDRFAVAHQSEVSQNKGTGIGLSLVKEIVELHKGKVSTKSSLGNGSTFIVSLFIGKEQFNDGEVNVVNISQDHYEHNYSIEDVDFEDIKEIDLPFESEGLSNILVVEDNRELRDYLRKNLVKIYNVMVAKDGKEGLKMAKENGPDLIISDIMMPGLSGIELLDCLRNEIATSHIPVILLTAKTSVESELEGMRYGADAYITKPFKMDVLKARIKNLISLRQTIYQKYGNHEMKVVELAPDEIVVTARDEEFIKNVIKIIEENMSNTDFNIEQISVSVGMGRTTFFKKLKSLTGMAPVEFLRDMKLKRGYQLLETGEFTISEIAFKLGFNDAGYFTKCFKEKYKTTPTAILKSIKKSDPND